MPDIAPGRPLRVCHVVAATAGATWMVEQLRELRDRHNCEVAAVVPSSEGALVDQLRAQGIPWHACDLTLNRLGRIRSGMRMVRALARLFRQHRFDVVQTHLFVSMMLGRIAAWLADVPARVSMVAGPFHLEAAASRQLDAATAWMDSVHVASCHHTLNLYRQMGLPEHELALVYYGSDERRFEPATIPSTGLRAELGWREDVPLVGMVAYFYPPLPASRWIPLPVQGRCVKGHRDFMRAIPLVLTEFPDAKFILVGSGWDELGDQHLDAMKSLTRELGVEASVAFLGFRSDVPRILRQLDVAVQPSLQENLGGTIEALFMACPTVATRVGGLVDSVRDGETGVLVDPAKPEDLAAGIMQLLREPNRARRLGEAGRALMLERFTLRRTVEDLYTCYASLLTGRTGRRRGYRPWVIAWRWLLAGPMLSSLALRLTMETRILPRWQAGRRPWHALRAIHAGVPRVPRQLAVPFRLRYAGYRLLVHTRLIGPYRSLRARFGSGR